jgi:SAM-dependent methyltransferase
VNDPCQPDTLSVPELRLMRDTITVYNDPAFAEMYFEKWRHDLPDAQLSVFSRLVGVAGTILDAGCGPGHHADDLHRRGHPTTGIDLAMAELHLAKANFHGPEFVRANMLHTPFTDGVFAGIWACASVMHLPQSLLGAQLAEFHRVLRPDGIIALTLTVESEAHRDRFGRFFESYPRSYLTDQIARTGFAMEDFEQRTRDRTTEQEGRQAGWITITARKTSEPRQFRS